MKMPKILLVSPIMKVGGISNWTKGIMGYWSSMANSGVELVQFYETNVSTHQHIGASFFYRILSGIKEYLPLVKGVSKLIKTGNYTGIHICSSASMGLIRDFLLIRQVHKRGVKAYIHFHFGRIPALLESNGWETIMLKKVCTAADSIIVLDEASYTALKAVGYDNVSVCPNPLSEMVANLSSSENLKRNSRSVMFAGHANETKGVIEIVKACRDIPDVHLDIFGLCPDDMRKRLLHEAGENSEKWLTIHGNVSLDTVIYHMKSCAVFALPSYSEGFPNVIIEAMACATPIIATPVGAISQILEFDSESPLGLKVEVRDSKTLNEAIQFAFANPNEMRLMSENAKKKVMSDYTIEKVWKRLYNIWMS